jgi:hypothetical protein
MKISPFVLPLLVQSQDDTSTLLSLKVHTALETGVDHLLDAVGSRNVTQMSSLLQNLVEETISEGPYELDQDVTSALDVIKRELLADIRGALKESHCYDQSELHNQIKCFQSCEDRRKDGVKSCGEPCDGWAHKQCREDLLGMYKVHITACRALDDFVWSFSKDCDLAPKKCCLLSHTTWNCGGLCSGTIAKLDVDGTFGVWLNGQIAKFEAAHIEWLGLYGKCKTAYEVYVEQDAKCDCEQARCETTNCKWDQCNFLACEFEYQQCWASCDAQKIILEKEKECLEKDRKIDWSATEKIECYVNVLLEKPTKEDLKEECGTEDCYNVYREHMYKRCNEICVEVDFGEGHHTSGGKATYNEHTRREHIEGDHTLKQTDSKDQDTHQGADQDVTGEGSASVRTTHRGAGEDGRCTSHLDLDYQLSPCCQPCMERPSRPCEPADVGAYGSDGLDVLHVPYMWLHYGQHGFLSKADVEYFSADICWAGEHTKVYAYNLCPCIDCEKNPPLPPQPCDASRACAGGVYTDGAYDYSVHDIVVNCDAISKSDPTYGAKEEE